MLRRGVRWAGVVLVVFGSASCGPQDMEGDGGDSAIDARDGSSDGPPDPLIGRWSDQGRYGTITHVFTFGADGVVLDDVTDTAPCNTDPGRQTWRGMWTSGTTTLTITWASCAGIINCPGSYRLYCGANGPPATFEDQIGADGQTLTLTPEDGGAPMVLTRVQ